MSTDQDHVARIADRWRAVRPDLDVSPLLLLGRVEWVQARADAALRPTFAAAGLGNGEFNALAALRRSGPPHALSPGALAEAMLVTSGAVTKRIDRLVGRGLVTRETGPADGRERVVTLTGAGRELVDELITRHLANEDRLLAGLDPHQRARLTELLELLVASVGGATDPG